MALPEPPDWLKTSVLPESDPARLRAELDKAHRLIGLYQCDMARLESRNKTLYEHLRILSSRWRENDMIGVGIALARIEDFVGFKEQGA